MNETLKIISQRYSCRAYLNKPVDNQDLELILEAAIQAPSARNRQLCDVTAITNPKIIDELSNAIQTVFKERGDSIPEHYHCAYHAPVFVIVSGPEFDSLRVEDGTCMLENIFLGAASLNLGTCWINQLRDTQDVDQVRQILTKIGIPINHQIVGCAALGYPQDINQPKAKNKDRIHIVESID